MIKFNASYFSKNFSKKEEAIVNFYRDQIEISLKGDLYSFEIKECQTSYIFKGRPLIITLPNGARLELTFNNDEYGILKKIISRKSKLLSFKNLSILTIIVMCVIYASFKYIIPSVSSDIADLIPKNVAKKIDVMALKQLNHKKFKTKLSEEKQKKIRTFLKSHTDIPVDIYFKNIKNVGANAFALASESIIITDDLVKLLDKNELLLPVFLHEVGHLKKKHVLNQLISVLTFQVFLILTAGQSFLLSTDLALLSFSRDLELEADAYALKQLSKYNYSPNCFAKSFEILKGEGQTIQIKYLSSHPNSQERIEKALNAIENTDYKINCD